MQTTGTIWGLLWLIDYVDVPLKLILEVLYDCNIHRPTSAPRDMFTKCGHEPLLFCLYSNGLDDSINTERCGLARATHKVINRQKNTVTDSGTLQAGGSFICKLSSLIKSVVTRRSF